jgi:DNA-binding NtrC family response regulator
MVGSSPRSHNGSVLLVEDDARLRFAVAAFLRGRGYEVSEVSGCAEAMRSIVKSTPDVVLLDLQLADGDAFQLLPSLRAVSPAAPVYIITGHGSIDSAVRAVKEGAEDFLTKPLALERIVEIVAKAVERRCTHKSEKRLRRTSGRSPSVVSSMLALDEQVERLRNAQCSVLILGETGTGKSLLARHIHTIGSRGKQPFVDVNCAGLSREFVESELFGHERGAFTGAHATKSGLFDEANGGSLFLDEIGDIDLQVQPKVLKVLEERRFRRMGDVRERDADVRLISATHHDLLDAVAKKTFRADLYYRISTVTLTIPPLRERRADIANMAKGMLRESHARAELHPDAIDKLVNHSWPGNIRELKNVVERAVLLCKGEVIAADDIRLDSHSTLPSAAPVTSSQSRLLAHDATSATRDEVEREHIKIALEAEGGRVQAAARRLGMPRSTLYWKLKHLGITRDGTNDDS